MLCLDKIMTMRHSASAANGDTNTGEEYHGLEVLLGIFQQQFEYYAKGKY
jgi:hypothetical protein